MWWSRLAVVLCLLALGPMGCGFSPLYAKSGGSGETSINTDLAAIRIGPIKDRSGQMLRNALVQRLTPRGEPGDYRYYLTVSLTQTVQDLGVRRDAQATLGLITLTANFTLTSEERTIASSQVRTTAYFDFLGPRYASIALERDAEERAIEQVADQIRSQVAALLTRYRANPDDPTYRKRSSGFEPTQMEP